MFKDNSTPLRLEQLNMNLEQLSQWLLDNRPFHGLWNVQSESELRSIFSLKSRSSRYGALVEFWEFSLCKCTVQSLSQGLQHIWADAMRRLVLCLEIKEAQLLEIFGEATEVSCSIVTCYGRSWPIMADHDPSMHPFSEVLTPLSASIHCVLWVIWSYASCNDILDPSGSHFCIFLQCMNEIWISMWSLIVSPVYLPFRRQLKVIQQGKAWSS